MNPRRAFVLVIAIVVAALAYVAARYAREGQPAEASARAGEPAKSGAGLALRFYKNPVAVGDFTVRDLDGRTISSASLRGKVTLINFWATWCGPCRAEIPDLVALQQKYRDTLQIIGISQDEAPSDVVRRFAADHNVNYPIVMMTAELEKQFPGIVALPTSFVLDRDARIVQKHVGMLTAATTEAEARSLAGLPVDATVEHVDQAQGLKLENGAQAINIPGVDLAKLSVERRTEALQKLNSQPCTCGCDLTVARCRVDDPNCSVSLPLARRIVQEISGR
ncbi:MAG TPA: TlpA disulfide reductase family protein [Vicinamibacterales bacterium]|jgi:thiol-disulfide isomerase/thioredoxin|nr:TlpA disulfide reductase family protein [Vicinamibacterales bacterium]